MTDYSCTPSIIPAPAAPSEPLITNDGWFPDIDPAELRKVLRLRDAVTPERLRDAALAAIAWAAINLERWQVCHVAAGHASLEAVPTKQLDGESRLLFLYRRAIAAAAKAELVERYRDMDITAAGQRKVEDLDLSIGELRRDATHAIRDLIGTTRTSIELI